MNRSNEDIENLHFPMRCYIKLKMPPVKKRQKLYKQQFQTLDGRFGPKKRSNNNHPTQYELNNREGTDDVTLELEFSVEEWGDDDDSGWEDEFDLEKEKKTQSKLMMIELGKK
ncbi:unnamed protein product [Rhizophagus irregularis]|nr:unnamed protein product [Rhizophagus irregularis]CAB5363711.1 unnamed protein product [Rhizophagus irregularis]